MVRDRVKITSAGARTVRRGWPPGRWDVWLPPVAHRPTFSDESIHFLRVRRLAEPVPRLNPIAFPQVAAAVVLSADVSLFLGRIRCRFHLQFFQQLLEVVAGAEGVEVGVLLHVGGVHPARRHRLPQ